VDHYIIAYVMASLGPANHKKSCVLPPEAENRGGCDNEEREEDAWLGIECIHIVLILGLVCGVG
jgi:hypothetical protein